VTYSHLPTISSDRPLAFALIERGIFDPRKFGREIPVIRYVLLLFIVSLLTSSAYVAKGVDPDVDGRIVLDLSEEGKFLEREFAQENGLSFQEGDRSLGDEDGHYVERFDRYRGMNITFVYPEGWKLISRGDLSWGKISIDGTCARITLNWLEDPGLDPESCLDQVARAYRSESLHLPVFTAKKGTTVVNGQSAATIDLYYKYGRYGSETRLVAWISPRSNRFFYASVTPCLQSRDQDLDIFEQMIESFQDIGRDNYVELDPRSTVSDAWAIVLQDLLNSYHHVGSANSTTPGVKVTLDFDVYRSSDGVDHLSSEEDIVLVDSFVDDSRVCAVQELLETSGYRSALMETHGVVWIVVQDFDGKWQALSLPLDIEKCVAVLVLPDSGCGWYSGLIRNEGDDYGVCGIEDKAGGEGARRISGGEEIERERISGGGVIEETVSRIQYSSLDATLEKDCNPSCHVKLQFQRKVDLAWSMRLRDLLELYSYAREESQPDYAGASQVCWALLEGARYDASLMTGYEGHPLWDRVWVVVKYPESDGYVAVETLGGCGAGLGNVVFEEVYGEGIMYNTSLQYSHLHPEIGMWLEPKATVLDYSA